MGDPPARAVQIIIDTPTEDAVSLSLVMKNT